MQDFVHKQGPEVKLSSLTQTPKRTCITCDSTTGWDNFEGHMFFSSSTYGA